MSARVLDKMGMAGVVAIAAACTLLYALWGASILRAEHQAGITANDTRLQLARGN